jgi:hypothetical protein
MSPPPAPPARPTPELLSVIIPIRDEATHLRR